MLRDELAGGLSPVNGHGPVARHDAILLRCWRNWTTAVTLGLSRMERRAPLYPRLPWKKWTLACVALALACFFILDPAAGRHYDNWPSLLSWLASESTSLGLGKWYLVPSLLLVLCTSFVDWRALPRRRLMLLYNWNCLAVFVLAAAGVSGALVLLLKNLFGRARPLNYVAMGDFTFHPLAFDARFASFPSGHATVVGAVCAILLLLCPRWKTVIIALAIWVASTRVFVSAHYPSDTVIGFGLGFGVTVWLAVLFARVGLIFVQRPAGLPQRRSTFRLLPSRAQRRQVNQPPLPQSSLVDVP